MCSQDLFPPSFPRHITALCLQSYFVELGVIKYECKLCAPCQGLMHKKPLVSSVMFNCLIFWPDAEYLALAEGSEILGVNKAQVGGAMSP